MRTLPWDSGGPVNLLARGVEDTIPSCSVWNAFLVYIAVARSLWVGFAWVWRDVRWQGCGAEQVSEYW
jgi:hypothetical protein